jgi:hypothetical protein
METMIERVASAIADMRGEGPDWRLYSDNAYAILREMRTPTEDMVSAAKGKAGVEAWEAMIDAVLAEPL